MSDLTYKYRGALYPEYIRRGNACQFIAPAALHFCQGSGIDVGAGKWPLQGAIPVDLTNGGDAMRLPEGQFDFIFSSHCLEHIENPIAALEHWKSRLKPTGVLFLYLPHPEMMYWRPQNCRKHLHSWQPRDMDEILKDLGFPVVMRLAERDAFYSFALVGFLQQEEPIDRYIQQFADGRGYIHADPQMDRLFQHFGADIFRRSAVLEDFAGFVARTGFRGKRCVEIGTFNGLTTLILARHFDEVVSIDTYPYTAKHRVLEYSGVKNVRFVDVQDNAEKAAIINGLDFDAAFSDGNHVSDTETDFELVKRCGRVMFHEYYQQQPAVWNLVKRLRAGGGGFESQGRFALWTAP